MTKKKGFLITDPRLSGILGPHVESKPLDELKVKEGEKARLDREQTHLEIPVQQVGLICLINGRELAVKTAIDKN